jgi:RNA polymerase sigma factor (sigma-70 family)
MARAIGRSAIDVLITEREGGEPTRDERLLVERAQSDREAFATLYDRYLVPIYRFCYLRLDGKEAAEDATSLVFTRALAAIGSCDPNRFRAWLFAIARNVVVDHHRGRTVTEPIDSAANVADPSLTPLDEALVNDAEQTVVSLLRLLTPEQREIVELRLAGLTRVEIADALNRSPGAIRAAQFRAYARLRELLAERGINEGSHR